jgi:hypothetical protein
MVHSDQFVLVDRDGRARGYYASTDPAAMQHLAADAAELSGQVARAAAGR